MGFSRRFFGVRACREENWETTNRPECLGMRWLSLWGPPGGLREGLGFTARVVLGMCQDFDSWEACNLTGCEAWYAFRLFHAVPAVPIPTGRFVGRLRRVFAAVVGGALGKRCLVGLCAFLRFPFFPWGEIYFSLWEFSDLGTFASSVARLLKNNTPRAGTPMGGAKHPGRNETPQCRGDGRGRGIALPNPTNVKALPIGRCSAATTPGRSQEPAVSESVRVAESERRGAP